MMAPAPATVAPVQDRLLAVRREFVDAVADTRGEHAEALRMRLQDTNCLRDLWHARGDVFQVVGLAHGEAEAGLRLGRLSRHFVAAQSRPRGAPQ